MHELFSRTDNPNAPIKDQKFYELCLGDSKDIWPPGFIVRQARAQWSTVDGEFIWDEIESEYLPTLEQANERYRERRSVLAGLGFIYSDLDL
jgi:hypothetical protein